MGQLLRCASRVLRQYQQYSWWASLKQILGDGTDKRYDAFQQNLYMISDTRLDHEEDPDKLL